MASKKLKKEKDGTGHFQWFLFIILPLVFAVTITLIVLTMAGVDTLGYAKKAASGIPGISSLIGTEESAVATEPDQSEVLSQQLEEKQAEIETLQAEKEMNERTIEELNQEIVKLQNQMKEDDSTPEESTSEQVASMAGSFREMDPENAAAIVNNLNQETALQVLKSVPAKERGLILENMEPELAASLTSAFLNQP